MTDYRAGDLRHRVTIQRRSAATGTRGQSTESWSTLMVRWGQVEELSGVEGERARKIIATATHVVRMRKPRGETLTAKDRIVFRGATLNIGTIIERGTFLDDLEILCRNDG